jgi:hypothetical protein
LESGLGILDYKTQKPTSLQPRILVNETLEILNLCPSRMADVSEADFTNAQNPNPIQVL